MHQLGHGADLRSAGVEHCAAVPSRLPDGVPAPADGALPFAARRELGRSPFGIYVHVPFCTTRCGYCDFTTYTADELGPGVSRAAYADTAVLELRLARRVLAERAPKVETVFFGGGTPTLLPAAHLGSILREIDDLFGLAPGAEVTTEANPESVTPAYLERLREVGFTRISFGMQSAAPHVLRILDRQHTPGRAVEVVAEARRAGFAHVNLDLIYGTPGESEADWQASLDTAVAAGPDHVSAYALVVEEGTAMARRVRRGELPEPDDDVLADRYVQADETLSGNGFGWYEVSNWARGSAARSRHNRLYWTGGDWWGVGPGAHSHVGGVRWWNVRHPAPYAAKLHSGQSPAAGRELLEPPERRMEQTMLGLRLREGLAVRELSDRGRRAASDAAGYGLLDRQAHDDGRAVLTLRGRLLADAVARDLTD
jgi:putative oxygen-independent coproporphyrinogen III oxidase